MGGCDGSQLTLRFDSIGLDGISSRAADVSKDIMKLSLQPTNRGKNMCTVILIKTKAVSSCDMIKGIELDVGNIDFELYAKRGDKFLF